MSDSILGKYFKFMLDKRPVYFRFNKQLAIGELAGFGFGIGVAEAAATVTKSELAISVSSGVADYACSILGFLGIFYRDSVVQYQELGRKERFKLVMKDAFSLWPSIAAADIAFIFARQYLHYVLLLSGLEAGIAASMAHFAAFGIFNGVAILSRSIIDYLKSSKR